MVSQSSRERVIALMFGLLSGILCGMPILVHLEILGYFDRSLSLSNASSRFDYPLSCWKLRLDMGRS
jgi:hypothetical protein